MYQLQVGAEGRGESTIYAVGQEILGGTACVRFLITEERGPRCVVSVTHVSICLAAIGPIGAPSPRKTSWGK